MRAIGLKRGMAAACVAGGVLVGAGVAMAASTTVTDTDNVHLRVVKSSFDDGFAGAWHTHPGLVVVQVERGFFKLYQGGCEPRVVGPGETFVEVPGVPVRGEARGAIAWTTTFIYETGQPASSPAADPCT